MKLYLFIICFLLFIISSYSQSAWVKAKGEMYTQLSYNDISNYNKIFNKKGDDLSTSRVISDRTIQWYSEYGLTDKLTLLSVLTFKSLKTGEKVTNGTLPLTIEKGTLNTLGNTNLGIRYKLNHSKYNIATQFQIELPTNKFDKTTGLSSGIDGLSFIPSIALGKGTDNLFFKHTLG